MQKKTQYLGVLVVVIGAVFVLGAHDAQATGPTYLSSTNMPDIWNEAGSPYVVDGDIYVEKDVTIEPGTIIKIAPEATLIVTEKFIAKGEQDNEIVFTSIYDDSFGGDTNGDGDATEPVLGSGGSLILAGSKEMLLENVSVFHGGTVALRAIEIRSNSAVVRNSKLQNNYVAIEIYQSQPTIEFNDISSNVLGVAARITDDAKIENNAIYGNINGIIAFYPTIATLDARNNWWGFVSGPYFSSILSMGEDNLDGEGNAVSDGVLFDPWLNESPIGQYVEPACENDCFSSVMFLPGLEASRMYEDGALESENQLWEPNYEADVEKLYLDEDGKSLNDGIYTKDVIDEVNVTLLGQVNIYKSFLADLDKWKNEEGLIADYASIPYDWRLSLDDILEGGAVSEIDHISYVEKSIAPYIVKRLRELASTSKSGKVTIVAHSNGGLVAKALTNKLGAEAESLIDKIVFVAVPQVGTPQAIGGLLHGYDQGIPKDWFPLLLSPQIARTLAGNMPGAYHLLPSNAYFNGDGSETSTPVISFEDGLLTQTYIEKYGYGIGTPAELHNFLLDPEGKVAPNADDVTSPSTVNSQLLTYAENVHQLLDDSWTVPSSISIYQIAGFGEETLGKIKYWTGEECVSNLLGWCLESRPKLQYSPEIVIDGDGTVAAPSALAMSVDAENVKRYWVDLDDYDDVFTTERNHADILEVLELRSFIKDNILTQSSTTLPTYLSDSMPSSDSEKRLQYILHSPLALSVYDSLGNEISATNSTIPGARYKRFGEVQYISLPASIAHTLEMDGLAEGSFTLEMQETQDETVLSKAVFAGIPTSDETEVTMDVIDGTIQNALPLSIDFDGDNVIDLAIKPKAGETVTTEDDITPPEARIFFDTAKNSIAVEGIDEGGQATVASKIAYSSISEGNKKQTIEIATTTATITDGAGNATVLVYEGLENEIAIKSISYNGIVTNVDSTTLGYDWNIDERDGAYRTFVSSLSTASEALKFQYQPKKDVTIMVDKPLREALPGLVIPEIMTKQGVFNIKY